MKLALAPQSIKACRGVPWAKMVTVSCFEFGDVAHKDSDEAILVGELPVCHRVPKSAARRLNVSVSN